MSGPPRENSGCAVALLLIVAGGVLVSAIVTIIKIITGG